MNRLTPTRYDWLKRKGGFLILILFFSLLAFFLRIIPLLSGDWAQTDLAREPDVLYHLRQIEYIQNHFPVYSWFEPMTNYPFGADIHWGPVYSLMGACLTLLAGGAGRPDMIGASSWLPVLMAVLLVPVYYLLGRVVWDHRAGLCAALFIAILPGMLFHRSVYGYVDHHIAEMLFTSLFCLGYLTGLRSLGNNTASYLRMVASGLGAGAGLAISVAIIPTVITFSMVIGLSILSIALFSQYIGSRQILIRFVVFNSISLLPAIFALLLIGIHDFSLSLKTYSSAHILVYGALILAPYCLVLLTKFTTTISFRKFVLVLFGFVIGLLVLSLLIPVTRNMLLYHMKSLFLVSDIQNTVSELSPWGLRQAVMTYLTGWVLCIAGAIFSAKRLYQKKNPAHMFLLIWFFVMLVSTVQHWRFEYYLAGPFVLLVSIASSDTINRIFHAYWNSCEGSDSRKRKAARKGWPFFESSRQNPGSIFLVICIIIFICWSISCDLTFRPEPIKPDQEEAMVWLKEHSPSPGMSLMDTIGKEHFRQPDQSYGVLAWWVYGHMITWLAERIPYSNPFQDGAFTAARLMTDTDEEAVYLFLNQSKGKYVITDTPLVSDIYTAVLTWRPGFEAIESPRMYEVITETGGSSVLSTFLAPGYYLSLAPRLHVYDGSDTLPGDVYTIQYETAGFSLPHKNGYTFLGKAVRIEKSSWNITGIPATGQIADSGTVIAQTDFAQPVVRIPALVHFRLVYESGNQTWSAITRPDGTPYRTFSSVKIFEVVPGAHVAGEGTIELTLRTNTGREFVYRQESRDGEFILPYPTDTCSGDVCPIGLYRLSSGEEVRISEQKVKSG